MYICDFIRSIIVYQRLFPPKKYPLLYKNIKLYDLSRLLQYDCTHRVVTVASSSRNTSCGAWRDEVLTKHGKMALVSKCTVQFYVGFHVGFYIGVYVDSSVGV